MVFSATESAFLSINKLRLRVLRGKKNKKALRTGLLLDSMTKLLNTKDSISVVNDQRGSPTNAADFASTIIKIILTSVNAPKLFGKNSALPYGVYQFTNSGETTWYEFAKKICELGKKYKRITQDCTITPCSTEEYPVAAKRPHYSVMSKEKIQKALKIKIPSWEESLEKFIKSDNFKGE